MSRAIYLYGTHEPDTTAFFHRRLRDSNLRVFFDLGSHMGYYPLTAAALLKNRGRVEAFEPIPWVFKRFEENCRLNNFENIHLHQKAVAKASGEITLFLPYGHGAWSTNSTSDPKGGCESLPSRGIQG
jgi:FkbM family methyltransferase